MMLNINDQLQLLSLMCFASVLGQVRKMKTPLGWDIECNWLCNFGGKHDNTLEGIMNMYGSTQDPQDTLSPLYILLRKMCMGYNHQRDFKLSHISSLNVSI